MPPINSTPASAKKQTETSKRKARSSRNAAKQTLMDIDPPGSPMSKSQTRRLRHKLATQTRIDKAEAETACAKKEAAVANAEAAKAKAEAVVAKRERVLPVIHIISVFRGWAKSKETRQMCKKEGDQSGSKNDDKDAADDLANLMGKVTLD